MAQTFLDATQTAPAIAPAGGQRQARGLRDGSAIRADWMQALVIEGVVHGANTGTGTTPDTFNATYAAAEQDFYLFIPSGTKIIPLYIGIEFEDTAAAAVLDVFAAYSSNGDSAVTGTALTIYNFHTLASPASSLTATAVITSNGTTHLGGTDFLEFWRPFAGFGEDAHGGNTAATMGGQFSSAGAHWSARDFIAPVIGDAGTDCALSVYMGATGGTGFITVVWAEFAASRLA